MLGFAVPRGFARWVVWGSSPILSLGLLAVAMAWLPVLHLPNSAGWVLVAEVVLAGAAVGLVHVRPGREPARVGARLPRRADWLSAGVAMLVALGFGQLLLGRFSQPPGWDAMNHALMTRNIMQTASTAITSACSTGSTHTMVACTFYPLATDVSWAQAASLSGGHVSAAMTAWAALIGPLFLVIAVYGAIRMLGARPLVAGCAATATALLGPLWESMLTGRVPEEVAPGLSVGVAVLTALAICSRHPIRLGIVAGLGFAGLAMTHTYDVLFAATLATAFVVSMRSRVRLRRSLVGTAAVVGSSVLALAPFGTALLAADGARTSSPPDFPGHLGKAVTYWLLNPERYVLLGYPAPLGGTQQLRVLTVQIGLVITMACLLASPLCFRFAALRWARPWFAMWALWTAVGIWTSVTNAQPARLIASLWYGVPSRLATMMLPVYGVMTVAGGYAIVLVIQGMAVRMPGRIRAPLGTQRAVSAACVGVVAVLVVLAAAPSTWQPLRKDLARRTPIGSSYPRVFRWLAVHTPKGSVVAYDRHLELMTWSYADYSVPLLFGIPPLVPASKLDYAQRFQAWGWLVNTPGIPATAGCLVRKYAIAYVVVGEARMPGVFADYSRARLARSPRLTLAHQDGAIRVYSVNAAATACAGA